MRIGIAGYGNVGRFVEEVFGRFHEVTIYDPPLGLGRIEDLDGVDFAFICVPTPSRDDGACDVSLVEELVARIRPRRAIICESTVAVGTTDRLIETYHKPLVYVPEFVGESPDHPYRRLENRDFLIFGGYEPALSEVQALYETGYGRGVRHLAVDPLEAETVKYMENSFLALKVAFCNEFFDLCRVLGVDYGRVREAWLQDRRMGESHTIVTAERGYGGKCLPKDVAAVCNTARRLGVPMEILEAAQRANRRHRGRGSSVERTAVA
jgi:UDPglucose 6-dehydrogenase